MKNRRYWLFNWERYECQGGISDLLGTFETVEDAVDLWKTKQRAGSECYELIDTETMKEIPLVDIEHEKKLKKEESFEALRYVRLSDATKEEMSLELERRSRK